MNRYLDELEKKSIGVKLQLRSYYRNLASLPLINPYGRDFFTIPETTKAEHMYPNIIVVKATPRCLGGCAFCFRKYERNEELEEITEKDIDVIFGEYIPEYNSRQPSDRTKIKETLITGGDPFLLGQSLLEQLLKRAKNTGIELVRIGSRATSVSPWLITDELVSMLSGYKPLIVACHYNHIDELTPESLHASEKLLNAGIRLKNQPVLLRGINDNVEDLYNLFWQLNINGIEPYRLYHCVPVEPEQLRTTVREGITITEELQGMSGTIGHFHFSVLTPLGKVVGVTEQHILDEKNGLELIQMCKDGNQAIDANKICPDATYLELHITSITTKEGKIPKKVWYRDGNIKTSLNS